MEVYRKLRAEVCALQDYVSLRMPEALKGQHFSDPLMYLPAPPPLTFHLASMGDRILDVFVFTMIPHDILKMLWFHVYVDGAKCPSDNVFFFFYDRT